MREVKKPSVIPVYGIAVIVLTYCLLFPMYKLWHFLLCAALAAVGYGILSKIFPPTVIRVRRPEPRPDTGNPELDDAILQGRAYLKRIRLLNDAIPEEALSGDLDQIEALMRDIFLQVELEPDKLPKIRRMMNYYLPTTMKLVEKYAQLQGQADLPNVAVILQDIRRMVGTVKGAFRCQLDSLYEHDVVDITADIQVMEQMLSAHGLNAQPNFRTKES